MSKIKRKITLNLSAKGKGTIPKPRPSVFERLGTKASNTGKKEYCHHWAQSGSCPYGKGCKFSSTHTLISPSKQRAAKTQRRHFEDGHKREPNEEWDQWDPDELEDADPDDLERKRQELQRELELQMKMESKAKKKDKKKESSQSSDTSSSTTDSSSTSEDSSSSSTSSAEVRRKKLKKGKTKRSSSASSEEHARIKLKSKVKRSSKSLNRDKTKKVGSKAVKNKSVSPSRQRKKSETPPIKPKPTISKKLSSEKSPRPQSRSSVKEKHRTPSPKPKEKEREKEREREREKEKEKEREREKEKEREREREKERERAKERDKERQREKEKEHKKKDTNRSPKRDSRSGKDMRKRDTPDSAHSKERKLSPGRGKASSSSGNIRRDHKSPLKDDRRNDRRDDRPRSRGKDARISDRGLTRKDIKRDSRDRDRERDREKERRLAREREEAREKEREEALARCQERQRERERLKKEEEQRRRDRSRREDRGLDKPSGDRVERLLPHLDERISSSRKGHSTERDRGRNVRDRTPDRRKSPPDRRGDDVNKDRSYDRSYDRGRGDPERDYGHRDKDYESPYDGRGRQHDDRRYLDVEEHYGEAVRDERMYGNVDDRRNRRDMWDDRADVEREMDHRVRYGQRDDLKPNRGGGGDWVDHQHSDYPDHDWDRNQRRPLNSEWTVRDNWEVDQHKQSGSVEEEWRHYNRSMEAWNNEDRRRWQQDWRERSRPRSAASHHVETMSVPQSEDSNLDINRKKDVPAPASPMEETEVKLETAVIEDPNRSTPLSQKRPADESMDSPGSSKKICVKQQPLEDDLSEISDDADEILNRDEDISEAVKVEPSENQDNPESCPPVTEQTSVASQKSHTPPLEQQPPQSPAAVAAPTNKVGSIDEDNMELDFEEISEDELEEESKMRGLVDALGVDWSSLVAESKPRCKPSSCAKIKWEAHNVLVNLGVSVHLAGESLVKLILKEHADAKLAHQKLEDVKIKMEPVESMINGVEVHDIKTEVTSEVKSEPSVVDDVQISHPLAAIQVSDRERLAIRKSLFTSVGVHRRALAARRDLTIRRHLCNLPITDAYVEVPKRHDPELFRLAKQLV